MDWVHSFMPLAVAQLVTWLLVAGITRGSRGSGLCVAILLLAVSLCWNGYVALQMLLLMVVCIVGTATQVSWKRFAGVSGAIVAGVFVFGLCSAASSVAELHRLREEYPIVSLTDRLEYELAERIDEDQPPGEALSLEVERGLERLHDVQRIAGERMDGTATYFGNRDMMLARLHHRVYDQFVTSAGFGVWRMSRLDPDVVRLPPPPPVSLVCARSEPEGEVSAEFEPVKSPRLDLVRNLHWQGAGDFLNPVRFGYIEDREHVVGFQPHGFTRTPESADVGVPWRMLQLELISLLKHERPCAYESEFLPNMAELSSGDVPTRELDEFEARALPQLKTERDVVIDSFTEPGKIRMLGSLRANRDCLQCHHGRRGDLLGAFSYRLMPDAEANMK